jgi:PIN domain nuclease of toxin-antitoxin system
MAKGFVLDASALLASLFDEPGAATVDAALADAVISSVNYSEVIAKLIRKGEPVKSTVSLIDDLGLPIVPWDGELARQASDLSALAWTHGLSLGDRACIATARYTGRIALTAGQAWRSITVPGAKIQIIR